MFKLLNNHLPGVRETAQEFCKHNPCRHAKITVVRLTVALIQDHFGTIQSIVDDEDSVLMSGELGPDFDVYCLEVDSKFGVAVLFEETHG